MNCVNCGTEIKSPQKRYCNVDCQHAYEAQKIKTVCALCQREIIVRRSAMQQTRYKGICRSCRDHSCNLVRRGPLNNLWRGGISRSLPGKYSYDKDGIHWRISEAFVRSRDKGICQDCGCSEETLGYTLHVHHINPYRCCFSHAVSNLISLCRHCHKKADAKTPLWGGKPFGGSSKGPEKPHCILCLSKYSKLVDGYCRKCKPELHPKITYKKYPNRPIEEAKVCIVCGRIRNIRGVCAICKTLEKKSKAYVLRDEGLTQADIGIILGVTSSCVSQWLSKRGDLCQIVF